MFDKDGNEVLISMLQRSPDLAAGECGQMSADRMAEVVLQRSPDLAAGECGTGKLDIGTSTALQRSPDLAAGE